MGKTILILGGGTGGVVAANVLAKVLPKGYRVAVVDRLESHVFLAALPLVIVGMRKPQEITRSLKGIEAPNVQFIQAEVQHFHADDKTVQTDQGILSYDSLIVALGAQPEGTSTFSRVFNPYDLQDAARLHEELTTFSEGHIVIFISNTPFPGTIAPYEIALLVDSFFRHRRLRKTVEISFITPETRLLEFATPRSSERLRALMRQRNLHVRTGRKVQSLSVGRTLTLDDGDIPGDLFIGVPPHTGPAPFRDTMMTDTSGWLKVDPHTLATCFPDVYAIGDATGIQSNEGMWIPKVGFFAHYQAEVVARNLALQYAGKEPRFRFVGGALGASMLSGSNRGCFVAVKAYASPARMTLSSPSRMAFWSKVFFEKYWLKSWFRYPH